MIIKCIGNFCIVNGIPHTYVQVKKGEIYESSETSLYRGDMYYIPSIQNLIPKELFIPVAKIREDRLSELGI